MQKSLSSIAAASSEQIIRDTSEVILQKGLELKAPLTKEVRTHSAVAKAVTWYQVPFFTLTSVGSGFSVTVFQ